MWESEARMNQSLFRVVERLEQLTPALENRIQQLQAENDWLHQQMQELATRLDAAIAQVEAMMEQAE
jgi:hypothetical protein